MVGRQRKTKVSSKGQYQEKMCNQVIKLKLKYTSGVISRYKKTLFKDVYLNETRT